MQGRRDRSRSPGKGRDKHDPKMPDLNPTGVINQMMMANMYTQGNMLMSGMYPNMMMPGPMMSGGMMQPTGMEMMPATPMDMISHSSMDISGLGGQAMTSQGMTPQAMASQSMAPQNIGSQAMATQALATQAMTNQAMGATAAPMEISMMGGMMMDPASMLAMYPSIGATEMAPIQERKEIVLKHCKLTPPEPGTPRPPHRERPPGCRTIFVGGLPDKIRESTVRDIFENYGKIYTLRLSKKNFCHIRFDRESSVDAAMQISGYRVKLTSSKDSKEDSDDSHATSGWLHVDFALSRDDQYEFERRQRQAVRLQQAQMQQLNAQQEIARSSISSNRSTNRKSPSPTRIQPFSNAAIVQLAEKIKSEENFSLALPTLLSWLERGECSKKNANQFYSMIQATNSHIRRLFGEKMQAEDELQECKEKVKGKIENVIEQLEQVAKVFGASTHQRVWDHFTKPQRKNIETWQKMTQEFASLKEEFRERFENEDNEFNGYSMDTYNRNVDNSDEIQQLKRENESLQFQLEAYKNEVDVIKSDTKKEMEKFKAQYIARQALQGNFAKNPPLPSPAPAKPPPPPPLPDDVDMKVCLKENVEMGCGEAKLIGVMSAFLQVHPQGASLDYVVSYVRALFPHVTQATVHHVLQKHNDVFLRITSGVGANIENKWSFVAFQNDNIKNQPLT